MCSALTARVQTAMVGETSSKKKESMKEETKKRDGIYERIKDSGVW